jgi:hypothetical protein
MISISKVFASFVVALALAASSFAQDSNSTVVQLMGYVSDWNGKPITGATFHLKNANLTTLDTSRMYPGFFAFNALIPNAVIVPVQMSAIASKPFLRPDGLYFTVPQKMQQVTINLFTISGRKAVELVNMNMKPGNYRVNPYSGVKTSSQTYVLRACIGDQTSYFRVPMVGSRVATSTIVQALSGSTHAVSLAKKAAVVESLVVSAPNYVTQSWPLQSYVGSHYVILRTAAQAQNKVLSITCNMNQGTTDNDPQVTLCTAIFVQDMNKNYVNTMFVSDWLSTTGYAYPNYAICPDWRGPDSTRWSNLKTTDTTLVDAVSKATPIVGNNSFEFNPNNFVSLKAGTPYRFCIEMNVDNQYNILYADSITLGTQPQVRTPLLVYVPSKDATASVDGLTDVAISYK